MEIDKKLNFVIPIEYASGTVYAHSMPIQSETFDKYYMPLAATFTEIYRSGLGITAGPRVAALVLRDVSIARGVWDGPDGVEAGLVAEIRRLTNVALPGPNGWEQIPWVEAVAKGRVSVDDAKEVENAVTFFIVASAMHKRGEIQPVLDGAAKLWNARTSPQNITEFVASLATPTTDDNSGGKKAA